MLNDRKCSLLFFEHTVPVCRAFTFLKFPFSFRFYNTLQFGMWSQRGHYWPWPLRKCCRRKTKVLCAPQGCCVHVHFQCCVLETSRIYRTKDFTAKIQIKPVSKNSASSLLIFSPFLRHKHMSWRMLSSSTCKHTNQAWKGSLGRAWAAVRALCEAATSLDKHECSWTTSCLKAAKCWEMIN